MRKNFPVADPPRDPRWMIGLLLGMPLLVVFALGPLRVGNRPMPIAVAALIAMIFLTAFLVLGWAAKRRAIALDDGVLDVLATFYRRRVPVQDIDLDASRVIDLRERSEWRPWIKTNGYAMPGLYAGWFRSRNWTRLFCLVTDRQRVLLLPLRAGGALLLSPVRPIDVLVALRAVDDAQRGRR
jgi:hypothetical protein